MVLADPVRAENLVHGSDEQGRSSARPAVMITDHVPAVRLPPDHAGRPWLRLSRREEMWKTAEILILRHQLAVLQRRQPRRPKLNWADRALPLTLLGVIPKARRQGLRLLITPDTIVRWHRDIVRRRWAARSACGRTGRPATRREHPGTGPAAGCENPAGDIAGSMASSPAWGSRSQRRPSGKSSGPAASTRPRQTGPTWSQFLRSQAEAILACDFFTVDLLDGTQAYVLAVIEHATRRIRIIGITLHPTGEWTTQQARNLVMDLGDKRPGQVHDPRPRIKLHRRVRCRPRRRGIRTVLCNIQTFRMNAIIERSIAECHHELLDRTLVWNQAHLREICASTTHHNQHGRTALCTAPRR